MTSPSAADLADTEGSAPVGAVTEPPTAFLAYRRFRFPPVQRSPSPKKTGAISASPCMKSDNDVGRSPAEVITRVSAERLGLPDDVRCAPPLAAEFSHPWPAAPLLLHGQTAVVPSPKQKLATGPPPPGTSPFPAIDGGDPDFHNPTVIVPVCGGVSASKRK